MGTKERTKVGRQQWVSIDPEVDPIGAYLVGAFYLSTAPGQRLSAVATDKEYNEVISMATKQWGIKDLGISGHSGRAGWATRLRAMGVPFPEVRELGRWRHDASLRTYLDVIGAINLDPFVAHMNAQANWILEDYPQRMCLWHGAPPPHLQARIATGVLVAAGCGRDPGPHSFKLQLP